MDQQTNPCVFPQLTPAYSKPTREMGPYNGFRSAAAASEAHERLPVGSSAAAWEAKTVSNTSSSRFGFDPNNQIRASRIACRIEGKLSACSHHTQNDEKCGSNKSRRKATLHRWASARTTLNLCCLCIVVGPCPPRCCCRGCFGQSDCLTAGDSEVLVIPSRWDLITALL